MGLEFGLFRVPGTVLQIDLGFRKVGIIIGYSRVQHPNKHQDSKILNQVLDAVAHLSINGQRRNRSFRSRRRFGLVFFCAADFESAIN